MAEKKEEKSELEKIVPTKITLKIHGKEREIKFGFSAWAKLEKEYNGIKNLEKMQKDIEERPFQVIPHLLFLGLVDKEDVTEDNVLDEYGLQDMEIITNIFNKALFGSLPQDEEKKTRTVKKTK